MNTSANIANILTLAGLAGIALMLRSKARTGLPDTSTTSTHIGSYPNPDGATVGYRNNNPLNIEYNPSTIWQGEIHPSGHYRFAQFTSLPYGYRAAFRTIRTYITLYGLTTVAQIIGRWDSAAKTSYTNFVCAKTGWSPTKTISPTNRDEMISLVAAMSWMENGIKPDMTIINQGYKLYETV